ncbi:MAG: hypothetical protein GY940_00050, partial [bacterium]|nr:hypothetical protein [bacterium]
ELQEIETLLLRHPDVKEVVVTAGKDKHNDRYLCAYIVSRTPGTLENPAARLREHLQKELPDYMIPSYFVLLEKIPLTANNKIHRKALPDPHADLSSQETYTAPRDKIEEKLEIIWSGVLDIDPGLIGIDSNFFQLGGHSLKATVLTSRIHKELDVKIPLRNIFSTPSIRGLAGYIKTAPGDRFSGIQPGEEKEYYALSSAQYRLYVLQQIDTASFSYNMTGVVLLEGQLDNQRLEKTFRQLIERHESFRTSFHLLEEKPVQKIHKQVEFEIQYSKPGDGGKEERKSGK